MKNQILLSLPWQQYSRTSTGLVVQLTKAEVVPAPVPVQGGLWSAHIQTETCLSGKNIKWPIYFSHE